MLFVRAALTRRSRSSLHRASPRVLNCSSELKRLEIEVAASRLPRFLSLLDKFPKLAGFAELLILRDREFAPKKEIAKRVLVQDAMHFDPFVSLGEVDPVIFGAITV